MACMKHTHTYTERESERSARYILRGAVLLFASVNIRQAAVLPLSLWAVFPSFDCVAPACDFLPMMYCTRCKRLKKRSES